MGSGWTFDEKRHAGEEHFDAEEVARFDQKMPWDPSEDIEVLLEFGLSAEDTVVDFGTGTGVFPLAVAGHCNRVVALDVSESMLDVVRRKIGDSDVQNVDIVHDGFLSYVHQGSPASFAFSKDALHHLPDFWKVEALKNVGKTLEEGGIFRLRDFVFSFEPQKSLDEIETWIADKKESTIFSDEEIHLHFREEYSTYGFLLESMLERVGFEMIDATYEDEFYAEYVCRWRGPRK